MRVHEPSGTQCIVTANIVMLWLWILFLSNLTRAPRERHEVEYNLLRACLRHDECRTSPWTLPPPPPPVINMRRCELREISFEQALQHLLSQRSEVAKQLQAPIITQHQVYLPLRYRVVMGGIVRGECPSKIDRGKCPGGNCPGGMSGGEVSRGENVRFPPRRAISTCWEVAEMEFGLYGAD